MSTAPSPSSEIDPIFALDRSVTIGRMSSMMLNHTSAPFGTSLTSVTEPTSTPATRTGEPLINPGDVGKLHLQRIVLPEESAAAADGEDQQSRHDECKDRDDAEFQFGPGE